MNVSLADPCALEIANAVAKLVLDNQTSTATNSLIIQGVQLGTTVVLGGILSLIHRTHIFDFFFAQPATPTPPAATTPTTQSNLQTRANAGDTRATQVLNKITQWQAKYQAQYGTTAAPVTPATSYPTQPYQAPYMPPAPSSYYPGSSTPGDSESELDASDPEL